MQFTDWIGLSDSDIAKRDIAEFNLQAAMGTIGGEEIDLPVYLQRLNDWADIVARATAGLLPRLYTNPEYTGMGEFRFRMFVLANVLQKQFGVYYDPACVSGPANNRDSRTQLMHGLLEGKGGTCASMPFLYLAVGRRLGYPLFLVTAKHHMFLRWEDRMARFNIEATSQGFSSPKDKEYVMGRHPLTKRDQRLGHHMKKLTPRQEIGECLMMRAHCFTDHLDLYPAMDALDTAYKLDRRFSGNYSMVTMLGRLVENLMRQGQTRMSLKAAIEACSPPTKHPWEVFGLRYAKRELQRIVKLNPANQWFQPPLSKLGCFGSPSAQRQTCINPLSANSSLKTLCNFWRTTQISVDMSQTTQRI